ncbi:ATP-binding protein [Cognatishimia sp. SS12]|uniref:ATP-binding protein n=1 Tax=Cognatishimia sp. SS12 TaxID=2979465 RepID=UPI00232F29FE|nr:ATP-binding protein [Cognatishimia sp. SS12]MDC0737273.1 ATP-binding protein [Cognatishimia sp. SS12]
MKPPAVTKWTARSRGVIAVAVSLTALMGIAPFVLPSSFSTGLLVAGGALSAIAFGWALHHIRQRHLRQRDAQSFAPAIHYETAPCLITDLAGRVLYRNLACTSAALTQETLPDVFEAMGAGSGESAAILGEAAQFNGHMSEDVPTRSGTIRVACAALNASLLLWRIAQKTAPLPVATGLDLPMITVAESGTILFMSAAAKSFLGGRLTKIDDVFDTQALVPSDMNAVRTARGLTRCFILEKPLKGGRREIYFMPAQGQRFANSGLSIEDLPVAVIKTSVEGDILIANKMARSLLGRRLSQADHLSDVVEGLGRPLRGWLKEAAEERSDNLHEFLRLKRENKEVFVQVTLGRLDEENHTSLFVVLNDATELKTLEAKFVQSQKMQAIGQLAGGIAHDFNNLLTAISGHCDLLLHDKDVSDPDYSDLMQIYQNSGRAAGLVSQLLAYSRKQTLQPVTFALADSLDDLGTLLDRLVGETVSLNVHVDSAPQFINVDRQQFEQVIMNLVVNARDAMPEGGEIEIFADPLTLTEPLSRDRAVVPAGNYAQVRVVDHGNGIAPENQSKVFEPFFTTKRTGEGTGLGLSTAYGIVKQSGGFIFLDSALGQGTSFTLLFPVASPHPSVERPIALPKLAAEPSGAGVVLLVEDEAPVRAFASRALQLKGYSVLEADCAEAALDILEDDALQVDLFVTDVVMPGMDGPDWVRKARTQRPETGVIFMSGYAEDHLSEEEDLGDNAGFLPKPFSLAELSHAVERQINSSADAAV